MKKREKKVLWRVVREAVNESDRKRAAHWLHKGVVPTGVLCELRKVECKPYAERSTADAMHRELDHQYHLAMQLDGR